MNVAIGIGTLLLGGWVLSSPPDAVPEKPFAGYRSVYSGVSPYMNLFRNDTGNGIVDNYSTLVRPALQQQDMNRQFRNDIEAEATVPSADRTTPLLPSPGTTNPARPSTMPTMPGLQPPGGQQPTRASLMPLVPTEPAPPGALGTPSLLPPTQPMLGEGAGTGMMPMAGSGMWGSGGASMPMAPTYRRPATPSTSLASPFNAYERQRNEMSSAMSTPQKAFAGYQSASSGVSPYMNLFRTDTSNGTIDNYTTLVRPALQQQNANQQFGNDIFGLQRNARIQNATLQRGDRYGRTLQGVGTPQFYQTNGGGYNPYGP
jgi:hypothetical protein